jgi:hypothetical protein
VQSKTVLAAQERDSVSVFQTFVENIDFDKKADERREGLKWAGKIPASTLDRLNQFLKF